MAAHTAYQHDVCMNALLDLAGPWGAVHNVTDLDGPVHWIHWQGPADSQADPMLLVHGLGGSHLNWLDVGRAWSVDRDVYAVDVRGFGLTAGFPRDTTVLANRDLVVSFINQVIGRPVVIVGNSMGGMISAFTAASRPDLVTACILIDPALPLARTRPDPKVAARFAVFAVPGVAERAMRRARETVPAEMMARDLIDLCFADRERIDPTMLETTVRMARVRGSAEADQGDLERGFTRAARSLLRILGQRGRYFRMLASINVPVLLLHGDKDRLVSVAAARDAARRNPDWTYVEFSGVGHTPQLEVPDEVIPVVEGWLAEVHR